MTALATKRAAALRVLYTADADKKCQAALDARISSAPPELLDVAPPDRPARPVRPRLASPSAVPKRRLNSQKGRFALLHAIAHIEFNAIDLAFDMAVRFSPAIAAGGLDEATFIDDWFSVGADEARHFLLVRERLVALGGDYGDLPAHDGLWDAAAATADDPLARLAIAPMVLEARGLDVTPSMIVKLKAVGDDASAAILQIIYEEEIGHVATGARWFERLCAARGLNVKDSFRMLVATRFKGALKPPFNEAARQAAGIAPELYL